MLSEILVEPENHNVAVKYVQDVQNLMMLMNLLRDKYDSIQFEAFHSFKARNDVTCECDSRSVTSGVPCGRR